MDHFSAFYLIKLRRLWLKVVPVNNLPQGSFLLERGILRQLPYDHQVINLFWWLRAAKPMLIVHINDDFF